jgi:hypothetical protein
MASISAQPIPTICQSPPTLPSMIIDMQRDFLEPGGFGDALQRRGRLRRSFLLFSNSIGVAL